MTRCAPRATRRAPPRTLVATASRETPLRPTWPTESSTCALASAFLAFFVINLRKGGDPRSARRHLAPAAGVSS